MVDTVLFFNNFKKPNYTYYWWLIELSYWFKVGFGAEILDNFYHAERIRQFSMRWVEPNIRKSQKHKKLRDWNFKIMWVFSLISFLIFSSVSLFVALISSCIKSPTVCLRKVRFMSHQYHCSLFDIVYCISGQTRLRYKGGRTTRTFRCNYLSSFCPRNLSTDKILPEGFSLSRGGLPTYDFAKLS